MELSDSEHQGACPHWLSTRVFRGFSVGLDSSCTDQALWKVITNLEGDVCKNHKKSSRREPSHIQAASSIDRMPAKKERCTAENAEARQGIDAHSFSS